MVLVLFRMREQIFKLGYLKKEEYGDAFREKKKLSD